MRIDSVLKAILDGTPNAKAFIGNPNISDLIETITVPGGFISVVNPTDNTEYLPTAVSSLVFVSDELVSKMKAVDLLLKDNKSLVSSLSMQESPVFITPLLSGDSFSTDNHYLVIDGTKNSPLESGIEHTGDVVLSYIPFSLYMAVTEGSIEQVHAGEITEEFDLICDEDELFSFNIDGNALPESLKLVLSKINKEYQLDTASGPS